MAFATCGHEVALDARFCPTCGTTVTERVTPTAPGPADWRQPPVGAPASGTSKAGQRAPAPARGTPPPPPWTPPPAGGAARTAGPLAGLPDYYRGPFGQFDSTGGRFAPTWNWAAFLLGPLWYACRGLWAKGLLLFFLVLLSSGVLAVPAWIYAGVAGNYDLYLLRQHDKQLW